MSKNGDQQNAWTGLDFQVFLYRVDIIDLNRSIILWRDREGWLSEEREGSGRTSHFK